MPFTLHTLHAFHQVKGCAGCEVTYRLLPRARTWTDKL
jgi:hypothetical protein